MDPKLVLKIAQAKFHVLRAKIFFSPIKSDEIPTFKKTLTCRFRQMNNI